MTTAHYVYPHLLDIGTTVESKVELFLPVPPSISTDLDWIGPREKYVQVRDWLNDLHQRLNELANLELDWDIEGASPPNQQCVFRARRFASLLGDANLPPRSVSPSVEEGITFNFRSGSRYAAVEFLNEDSISLMQSAKDVEPIVRYLRSEEKELRAAIVQLRDFFV